MNYILRIARKEVAGFFSSPIAFIFLGSFLAVILFIFFWVETFFARNIADVRPLFEWMPLLLIFLVAAVTMRMWAEERRSGTLEFLLTAPVRGYQLVPGTFFDGRGQAEGPDRGEDCNANWLPDECDVAGETGSDCNGHGIPDDCEMDSDADQVPDDCDVCPESNLTQQVVVDGCATGIANQLVDAGCTMNDLIGTCIREAHSLG